MGADNLDGKVGRMYVPRQEIGSIALRKMKVSSGCSTPACCGNHSSSMAAMQHGANRVLQGLKRERHETAAAATKAKRSKGVDAAGPE